MTKFSFKNWIWNHLIRIEIAGWVGAQFFAEYLNQAVLIKAARWHHETRPSCVDEAAVLLAVVVGMGELQQQ